MNSGEVGCNTTPPPSRPSSVKSLDRGGRIVPADVTCCGGFFCAEAAVATAAGCCCSGGDFKEALAAVTGREGREGVSSVAFFFDGLVEAAGSWGAGFLLRVL